MTAAGWYNAQGDPAGTLRYWDGAQWVGEPQANTAAAAPVATSVGSVDPSYGAYDIVALARTDTAPVAAPAGPPVELSFLPGLKVLAVGLSILKAIPLVFTALLLQWLTDRGRDLERAFGADNADFIRDSVNTTYVVLAVLAVLLGIQLVAALREHPQLLVIIAAVLTLVDLVAFILHATEGALVAAILALIVAVAQAGATFWAWTVHKNRNVGQL